MGYRQSNVTPLVPRLSLCLLLFGAMPARGQDLIAAAKRVRVDVLDSTLTNVSFEKWLTDLRPSGSSTIAWEVNDCGEGGDGNVGPTCVEVILSLSGDSTAHASIIMVGRDGATVPPAIWDLAVGRGYGFSGCKTLGEWAAFVQSQR